MTKSMVILSVVGWFRMIAGAGAVMAIVPLEVETEHGSAAHPMIRAEHGQELGKRMANYRFPFAFRSRLL